MAASAGVVTCEGYGGWHKCLRLWLDLVPVCLGCFFVTFVGVSSDKLTDVARISFVSDLRRIFGKKSEELRISSLVFLAFRC